MTTQVSNYNTLKRSPWIRFCINFKKNWQLHLMILVPFLYFLIFEFGPLYGLIIAFRDYRPRAGIWGSAWMGLEKFGVFFSNKRWSQYVLNTLNISLYSLVCGFPMPIIFALIIHVNERKVLKLITQNVSYVPNFISTVILVGMINSLFSPFGGLYATIVRAFGGVPTDIRNSADAFNHLYQWSGVWQGMGWGAIIYVAAFAGVSPDLHEAAKIDGASRLQRIWNVDLPAIIPTISIMLIMRCAGLLNANAEKVWLMQTSENMSKSEVISTYVYKTGVGSGNLSYATAVGLMNSVINTFLITLANGIVDRLSDGENALF